MMELIPVRSLWGVEGPREAALDRIKAAGYHTVEHANISSAEPDERYFMSLLQERDLALVYMGLTRGGTVQEHLASFREHAETAQRIGAIQMTAHSGRDAFTDAEAKAFYAEVVQIEKDLPFVVGHETHRGRVFFNPWRTRDLLLNFPELKLCVDFSHWVCVAERLDWDDAAQSILNLCADRTVHVHTRVGFDQGPQVPDPRVPAYQAFVDRHFEWWRVVWKAQAGRGMKTSLFSPEFGPPPYLHVNPQTNTAAANLWDVTEWMRGEVRRRFPA